MSATVSGLDLYRCGGNGFKQGYGAVLVAVDTEDIDGLTMSGLNVASPTYDAIDFRPIGAPVVAAMTNVSLSDVEALGGPGCGDVKANTTGSAQLTNVCACATATSAPATCTVTNASAATFQVTTDTCTATACKSF